MDHLFCAPLFSHTHYWYVVDKCDIERVEGAIIRVAIVRIRTMKNHVLPLLLYTHILLIGVVLPPPTLSVPHVSTIIYIYTNRGCGVWEKRIA